jgi:hypothetical protein
MQKGAALTDGPFSIADFGYASTMILALIQG